MDLENQWRDDHGCGPDATDYSSGRQRVLVMKLTVPPRAQDGSFMTSFAQPIPDIRGGDVPATVVSNERISVAVQVYVHPAGTLGDVVALAGSGATPIAGTVVGDSCVDGDCALKGRVVDYRFEWNVHDTWCASRANDSSCGGTEDPGRAIAHQLPDPRVQRRRQLLPPRLARDDQPMRRLRRGRGEGR